MSVSPGEYVLGEIPDPLSYSFLDSTGAPIDLTAYAAWFEWQERDGAVGQGSAVVTAPASGTVTYTWTGAEFTTAGSYTAYFWTGNGTNRLASVPVKFTVRLPVGTVPSI